MESSKRLQFTTLGPVKTVKKKIKRRKTIRIDIKLAESNDKSCPEYSYPDLISQYKFLHIQKQEGEPPAVFNPTEAPLGDSLDNDDALKALAKKFEEKYGNAYNTTKKKKKRQQFDFNVLAEGYDENDSFIDNSGAHDEVLPNNKETKHGGFYINSGELDYRSLSDSGGEDEEDDSRKGDSKVIDSHRHNKIVDSDDDENTAPQSNGVKRKPDDGELLRKRRKMISKLNAKRERETQLGLHTPVAVPVSVNGTENPCMSTTSTLNTIATTTTNSTTTTTTINMSSVAASIESVVNKVRCEVSKSDKPHSPAASATESRKPSTTTSGGSDDEDGGVQSSSSSGNSTENNSSDSSSESSDSSSSSSEDEDDEKKSADDVASQVPETAKSIPEMTVSPVLAGVVSNSLAPAGCSRSDEKERALPSNIPPDLLAAIEELKKEGHRVKGCSTSQKFFTDNVKKILLSIETKMQETGARYKMQVYQHLSHHVPCGPQTLIKRAKQMISTVKDSKIMAPLSRLEEILKQEMPSLIERFIEECKTAAQLQGSETGGAVADEKKSKLPKKRYVFTAQSNAALQEVVAARVSLWLEGFDKKAADTPEEYITTFLEREVRLLWPKGWVTTRQLYRQSALTHACITLQNAETRTILKKPSTQTPAVDAIIDAKQETASLEAAAKQRVPVVRPPTAFPMTSSLVDEGALNALAVTAMQTINPATITAMQAITPAAVTAMQTMSSAAISAMQSMTPSAVTAMQIMTPTDKLTLAVMQHQELMKNAAAAGYIAAMQQLGSSVGSVTSSNRHLSDAVLSSKSRPAEDAVIKSSPAQAKQLDRIADQLPASLRTELTVSYKPTDKKSLATAEVEITPVVKSDESLLKRPDTESNTVSITSSCKDVRSNYPQDGTREKETVSCAKTSPIIVKSVSTINQISEPKPVHSVLKDDGFCHRRAVSPSAVDSKSKDCTSTTQLPPRVPPQFSSSTPVSDIPPGDERSMRMESILLEKPSVHTFNPESVGGKLPELSVQNFDTSQGSQHGSRDIHSEQKHSSIDLPNVQSTNRLLTANDLILSSSSDLSKTKSVPTELAPTREVFVHGGVVSPQRCSSRLQEEVDDVMNEIMKISAKKKQIVTPQEALNAYAASEVQVSKPSPRVSDGISKHVSEGLHQRRLEQVEVKKQLPVSRFQQQQEQQQHALNLANSATSDVLDTYHAHQLKALHEKAAAVEQHRQQTIVSASNAMEFQIPSTASNKPAKQVLSSASKTAEAAPYTLSTASSTYQLSTQHSRASQPPTYSAIDFSTSGKAQEKYPSPSSSSTTTTNSSQSSKPPSTTQLTGAFLSPAATHNTASSHLYPLTSTEDAIRLATRAVLSSAPQQQIDPLRTPTSSKHPFSIETLVTSSESKTDSSSRSDATFLHGSYAYDRNTRPLPLSSSVSKDIYSGSVHHSNSDRVSSQQSGSDRGSFYSASDRSSQNSNSDRCSQYSRSDRNASQHSGSDRVSHRSSSDRSSSQHSGSDRGSIYHSGHVHGSSFHGISQGLSHPSGSAQSSIHNSSSAQGSSLSTGYSSANNSGSTQSSAAALHGNSSASSHHPPAAHYSSSISNTTTSCPSLASHLSSPVPAAHFSSSRSHQTQSKSSPKSQHETALYSSSTAQRGTVPAALLSGSTQAYGTVGKVSPGSSGGRDIYKQQATHRNQALPLGSPEKDNAFGMLTLEQQQLLLKQEAVNMYRNSQLASGGLQQLYLGSGGGSGASHPPSDEDLFSATRLAAPHHRPKPPSSHHPPYSTTFK